MEIVTKLCPPKQEGSLSAKSMLWPLQDYFNLLL